MDINHEDLDGNTLLDCAIAENHGEVADSLIGKGAQLLTHNRKSDINESSNPRIPLNIEINCSKTPAPKRKSTDVDEVLQGNKRKLDAPSSKMSQLRLINLDAVKIQDPVWYNSLCNY